MDIERKYNSDLGKLNSFIYVFLPEGPICSCRDESHWQCEQLLEQGFGSREHPTEINFDQQQNSIKKKKKKKTLE